MLNSIFRYGFHWPPYCSVYRLHLHAIWPSSQVKFIYKYVLPKYSSRMWYFKTVCFFKYTRTLQDGAQIISDG